MCGFVVSAKRVQSTKSFTGTCIDTLARGPDCLKTSELTIGSLQYFIEFSHLFITQPAGYQPLETKEWLLVLNGEIYNYRELAVQVSCDAEQHNDSQVFFLHLQKFGLKSTLKKSSGMYSGLLINKITGHCLGFTDHTGKKPLLVWNSEHSWHVGTGIDYSYFDSHTENLRVLSPGIHEICFKNGVVLPVDNQYVSTLAPEGDLKAILKSAVAVRIPENIPFAVALSGGLDSSIIAYFIEKELELTPTYYVVGDELPHGVLSLMDYLGIGESRIRLIRPSGAGDTAQLVLDVCRIAKSYNPSIVSNGIATMLLARAIHNDGLRVLLGGEGADEFFCGYQAMYSGQHDPEQLRVRLVSDLHFTELRRLDLICSHHAVEARCPFLDKKVTQYALSKAAPVHCCSQSKTGKILLRKAFKHLLPDDIIEAPKEPFDITSGLQKQVIQAAKNHSSTERNGLKAIFNSVMGHNKLYEHDYFSRYPAFDDMIDTRYRKYKFT